MKYMKYVCLFVCLLSVFALTGCDNSEEMTPRIEELTDVNLVIPTTRLTYEERDIIKNMAEEYEKAVSENAAVKE